MLKRLLLPALCLTLLSGCYMAPLALIGPASSGFTSASLVQAGVSTSLNYVVKKGTGKTIGEHAIETLNNDVFKQTYFPVKDLKTLNLHKFKSISIHKN